MNGYVVENGEKYLWVVKCSVIKQMFFGMLDYFVVGGQVSVDIQEQNMVIIVMGVVFCGMFIDNWLLVFFVQF